MDIAAAQVPQAPRLRITHYVTGWALQFADKHVYRADKTDTSAMVCAKGALLVRPC